MAAFELDLLKLRRAEDEVEGDALVKCALGFDVSGDGQVKGVAVSAVAEEAAAWREGAAVHEATDACAEVRLVAVFTDDLAELVDQRGLCGVEVLACGPFGNAADIDVAGVDAVDDVVQRVGGIIGPVHDLAFDTFEAVECFRSAERFWGLLAAKDAAAPMGLLVVDEVVLGIVGRAVGLGADAFAVQRFVFHDAVEEGAGGGDALGRAGAFVDQLGEDTQGLAVTFESTVGRHQLVQFAFANVAEGRVAHVVGEADGFGQVGVDVEAVVELV